MSNIGKNTPENLTIIQHIKRQPHLFLGCAATAGILIYGVNAFRKGDSALSQKMMRWRVGMQGFTILMILSSVGFANLKLPNTKKKKDSNINSVKTEK